MTCRVYVGEYQDRITGTAATAYVVINENGQLVKAMAQKVKTNKGLSLQAVKLAVQGLCYLHGLDGFEKDYPSFEAFSKAIADYIDYYNNSRIQAKTKWMPPSKFREASMMKS